MKSHLRLVVPPLLLGLAACAAEYSKSEAPDALRVDGAGSRFEIAFAGGSDRLTAGEAARLDRMVLAGTIRPADVVEIGAAGHAGCETQTVCAAMVGRSRRSESEGSLSDRIALLSSRRATPLEVVPAPPAVTEVDLPAHAPTEDRMLAAKEQLIARLSAEVRPERRSLLSRGELAKVVDAATQAYMIRHGIDANPLDRRDLVTDIIDGLLSSGKSDLVVRS